MSRVFTVISMFLLAFTIIVTGCRGEEQNGQSEIPSSDMDLTGTWSGTATIDGVPDNELELGRHSFYGIVKVFESGSNSNERAYNYNYETIVQPSTSNVYSFFREQVDDFGVYGTVVFHFIWGLAICWNCFNKNVFLEFQIKSPICLYCTQRLLIDIIYNGIGPFLQSPELHHTVP